MAGLLLRLVRFLPLAHAVALHYLQQGHLQPEDDRLCHDDVRLKFVNYHLHYSNLRGYGPHRSQPEGMLISEMFPQSKADLLITTLQTYYPFNVSLNAITNDIASISMDAGSKMHLQMNFLERVSRQPLKETGPYAFTFMNFHELTVTGCHSYVLSEASEVEVAVAGGKVYSFTTTAGPVSPTRSLALTDEERASAVMMLCKEPTITVEVTMRQASHGDNFYITGPSSVVCPERAPCQTYQCPEFFKPAPFAEDYYCEAAVCTDADLRTCCAEAFPPACEAKYQFMLPHDCVTSSNLGGMGPDFDKPEGVYYTNVFPESGASVDMVLNARGPYNAGNASVHDRDRQIANTGRNGMHGAFGSVSVSAGAEVWVRASFVDTKTREPVRPGKTGFFFTVYDFDQEADGRGRETVSVSGYQTYSISNTSSIVVRENGKHAGSFESTVYGNGKDNPIVPMRLGDADWDKAVTFFFPAHAVGFLLGLSVGPGFSSRSFEFSGWSRNECPRNAECSSMQCPEDFVFRDDPDKILCAGEHCEYSADLHTCCVEKSALKAAHCSSMICPLDFELKALGESYCAGLQCTESDRDTCCKRSEAFSPACVPENRLILDAFDKSWSSERGHLVARYTNVLPHSNHSVNLKVTFNGLYASAQGSNAPRVWGMLTEVGLPNVSSVFADFHFLDAETGKTIGEMPEYLVTLFGGRKKNKDTTPRRVHITSHGPLEMETCENSNVHIEDNNTVVFGGMLAGHEEKQLSTMHLFALDDEAKKRAVSLRMNSSSFRLEITPVNTPDNTPWTNFIDAEVPTLLFPTEKPYSSADIDSTLLFAGASSLTCQGHASCGNFVCPSGFTLRPNATSFVCKGEACVADDYTTCCDCDPKSAFVLLPSQIKEHTLGMENTHGRGTMLIKNVFPRSKKKINLRIRAVGDYWPGNVSLNTLQDQFLNLNVRTSSDAIFRFEFVSNHGELVHLPFNFIFTVFDVDMQGDGGAREEVSLNNYAWYLLSNETSVVSERDLDSGELFFHATHSAGPQDNPSNPRALTDTHLHQSISFMMLKNIAKFNVTVKIKDGFGGRNIAFAGQTNLICSKREVCSSYRCPAGKVQTTHANLKFCLGAMCGQADEERCCKEPAAEDAPPWSMSGSKTLRTKRLHSSHSSHSAHSPHSSYARTKHPSFPWWH